MRTVKNVDLNKKIKNTSIIIGTLLILSSIGISINLVGEYEGKHVIYTEDYTAQVPMQPRNAVDLARMTTINNKFDLDLIPAIRTEGEEYRFVPPEGQELVLEEGREEYIIEFEGGTDQLRATNRIEIKQEEIHVETTVENIGETKEFEIIYRAKGPQDTKIFYPNAIDEGTNNYIVLTNQNHKGNSLGIVTNTIMTGEEPFQNKSEEEIAKVIEIEPGDTETLEATYKPMNIWTEIHDLEFSPEYAAFLENPLLNTSGELDIEITEEEPGRRTEEMLSKLSTEKQASENVEFEELYDVDMEESEMNSLEATMMYKELCIQEEIPCKIMIGGGPESKFAWIKKLEGDEWIDVNPLEGTRSVPAYQVIYEEPTPSYVEVEGDTPAGEPYLEATEEYLIEGIGTLILLAVTAVATLIVFVFLFVKSDYLIEKLTPKETENKNQEEPINGKYTLVSEKEDIEDRTVIPIFEKIKEENGKVDTEKYSEETKYSEKLIEHYIDYLRREGHIKMEEPKPKNQKTAKFEQIEISKSKKQKKKDEKNKKRQITPSFIKSKKLEEISQKIGVTKTQLLLIIMVVLAGIISLAVFLILL